MKFGLKKSWDTFNKLVVNVVLRSSENFRFSSSFSGGIKNFWKKLFLRDLGNRKQNYRNFSSLRDVELLETTFFVPERKNHRLSGNKIPRLDEYTLLTKAFGTQKKGNFFLVSLGFGTQKHFWKAAASGCKARHRRSNSTEFVVLLANKHAAIINL